MSLNDINKEISEAIVNLDKEKAIELAKKAVSENLNLVDVIEKGFGEGLKRIGDLWNEGEFFLPELMVGGNIMQDALNILMPHLKQKGDTFTKGKVIIATIEGDIHSIGKTIVGTMLSANGFEVHDLGADVSADKIISEAIEKDADIIGVSALLTSTMIGQKRIIELLKEMKIRDKFKVILGGAPVTQNWVDDCGADGYAPSAIEAINLVKSLIE